MLRNRSSSVIVTVSASIPGCGRQRGVLIRLPCCSARCSSVMGTNPTDQDLLPLAWPSPQTQGAIYRVRIGVTAAIGTSQREPAVCTPPCFGV